MKWVCQAFATHKTTRLEKVCVNHFVQILYIFLLHSIVQFTIDCLEYWQIHMITSQKMNRKFVSNIIL